MKMPGMERKGVRDAAVIALVWCASVLLVNPIGNFPLVDDWSFGRTVEHLLETGEYKLMTHGAMTLITNVIWGALFCLPTGFSFTALRFSTLVAALVGLIGLYVLIRDMQQSRRTALLVVLLLGSNPLYYVLSHGFMTDVLFITLLIWASFFFVRTLRTGSNGHWAIATMLALAATLSRQLALCVPIAFAAASLLRDRSSLRSVLRSLTPAVVCLVAYLAFYSSGLMQQYAEQSLVRSFSDPHRLVRSFVFNFYLTTMNLGLSLIPFLPIAMKNLRRTHAEQVGVVTVMATLTMSIIVMARAYYGDEILLPFYGNWLVKSGLGFTLLRDVLILKLDNLPSLPVLFWVAVSGLGLVGAVLLITTVSLYTWDALSMCRSGKPISNNNLVATFALCVTWVYFLPLLFSPMFFDKYVVPMIPFLVMAAIGLARPPDWPSMDAPRLVRRILYVLLVSFAVFSVVGTRDFLAWNRVRWTALGELMQDGNVVAEEIDGGFEFSAPYQPALIDPSAATSVQADVSYWQVRRETYLVAFGPVPGYTLVKEYSYQHWMPWHVQKIVVLRRQ